MAKYIKKEGQRLTIFQRDFSKKDSGYKKADVGELIKELEGYILNLRSQILTVATPIDVRGIDITNQTAETEGTIIVDVIGVYDPVLFNLYQGDVLVDSNSTGSFSGVLPGTYMISFTDAIHRYWESWPLTVDEYQAP